PSGAGAASSPLASKALSEEFVLPTDPVVHLVKILAGSFLMRSGKQKNPRAKPSELWPTRAQASVSLPDLYIGKLPVTVAQFQACVRERRCAPSNIQALGGFPDHPIVNVSWREALQYCAWLDRTVRERPETPSEIKRLLATGGRVGLPSEAEWEKAARGAD